MESKLPEALSVFRCVTCDAAIESGARFCGTCGAAAQAELSGDDGADDVAACGGAAAGNMLRVVAADEARERTEAVSDAGVVPGPPAEPEGTSKSGRGVRVYVVLGAAVAVLVAAGLGFMWQQASAAHARAERELTSARAQIARQTAANERLKGQLSETEQLASRRAFVLKKAEKVLGQVTPLLSAVDELQNIALDMKTARDDYQAASETLSSDLLSLGNYLLRAGDYADYDYVGESIDEISGDIDAVDDGARRLSALDDRYGKSSDRFDTRASIFNDAVEALKTDTLATTVKK